MNYMFYLEMCVVMALCAPAFVLSLSSQNHKDLFLSSDRDGRDPLALGIVSFALGAVAFYGLGWLVAGEVLEGVGLVLAALGVLILFDNHVSNAILHPAMGFVYAGFAVAADYFATMAFGGHFGYNMYSLSVTVPYVGAGTAFATLLAFHFASQDFKNRLIARHNGGYWMLLAGLAIMFLAPVGALVIVTAAAGALVATLGLLIVVHGDVTKFLLSKPFAVVSALLMVVAMFLSSVL